MVLLTDGGGVLLRSKQSGFLAIFRSWVDQKGSWGLARKFATPYLLPLKNALIATDNVDDNVR